ncbi:flagellin [Pseudoalteromonas denitrificans]|uniref:Flagellin C-terminal helical region n=1 Tax=Pseudoalteromonas denitrificans DSM 6059 TaxID=1123010 RepID=A0A1I1UQL2_9GAMM|nr:flagellin [Pseudoalteromonas denitrificans]SFD73081.1 flagellin C-terminal helical region [Pseudoalteromonas denitrificans DSM 6059]
MTASISSFLPDDIGDQRYRLKMDYQGALSLGNSASKDAGLGGGILASAGTKYLSSTLTNIDLNIKTQTVSTTVNVSQSASAFEMAKLINVNSKHTQVQAIAKTYAALDFFNAYMTNINVQNGIDNGRSFVLEPAVNFSFDLSTTGSESASIQVEIVNSEDLLTLSNKINTYSDITGVTSNFTSAGKVEILNDDGKNIHLKNINFEYLAGPDNTKDYHLDIVTYEFDGDTDNKDDAIAREYGVINAQGAGAPPSVKLFEAGVTIVGTIELASKLDFEVSSNEKEITQANTGVQYSSLSEVADIDVTKPLDAQFAVFTVDGALYQVDSQRARLGAIQNRLQNAINNFGNIIEKSSSSRSGIRDSDFALETSILTKG